MTNRRDFLAASAGLAVLPTAPPPAPGGDRLFDLLIHNGIPYDVRLTERAPADLPPGSLVIPEHGGPGAIVLRVYDASALSDPSGGTS